MTTPTLTSERLSLRPATSHDVAAIATVWLNGWLDGHLGHVPEELRQHRGLEDFRERVPERLDLTTVATLGGRVVGFLTAREDEIEQVYVDASVRGRGVGAALLRHGEHLIAASYDVAWLAVVAGNTRARGFYTHYGWYDAGAIEYSAQIAGGVFSVPCRRYEKRLPAGTVRTRMVAHG
ncbi:GNAT family N-acetyltransferase [Actinopolymorpha alba]|uniref:GNAT family N-acetyltransferase n=1 Tax=Actinopolymorpha alba TaxID=533267 RepID=UPI00037D6069|nr:GNAT family N-acetyltransferase [Actinopolymorpha alba]